jgi:hypothetical protein
MAAEPIHLDVDLDEVPLDGWVGHPDSLLELLDRIEKRLRMALAYCAQDDEKVTPLPFLHHEMRGWFADSSRFAYCKGAIEAVLAEIGGSDASV